jgi:hypothetical protein
LWAARKNAHSWRAFRRVIKESLENIVEDIVADDRTPTGGAFKAVEG